MEIELKFALLATDPQSLEQLLARVPAIAAQAPRRDVLHSTYYDTPDQTLRREGVALRVREVADADKPRWVQTLKMGGADHGALSQRGEWEGPLQRPKLDPALLQATPWSELDPDGSLFASLSPLFTTRFERLSWVVDVGDSRVELALDRGTVEVNHHQAALFELEIELLQGSADALFALAADIGQHLCLLPLHMSKSERAYRLAQGTLDEPLRARPPLLAHKMKFPTLAQCVLREAFLQFTANLYTLHLSDVPEVLHQARVGWRRFKSGLDLFKQLGKKSALPDLTPLAPLLHAMAQLRDLDVVAGELLPLHAASFPMDKAPQRAQWRRLEDALLQDIATHRAHLHHMLEQPAVGQALLGITQWLERDGVRTPRSLRSKDKLSVAQWLRKRVGKLAQQLKSSAKASHSPRAWHRVRIQAKHLRYDVESVRTLLPRKRAERWHQMATDLQTELGMDRDLLMLIKTAERLQAPAAVLAHLRQVASGFTEG